MSRSLSSIRRLAAIALPLGLAASALAAGHFLTNDDKANAAAAPRAVAAATPAAPVLVELYQSEGCSSCPPAEAYLNGIAGRANVIPLAFEVTYWDYLGWKDKFASPAYTQRQRDFAARSASHEVATPQFWINGSQTVVGANPRNRWYDDGPGGP